MHFWGVIINMYSLAKIVKYINFGQITYDDFTRFSILQIMYENYYHKQLAKISTSVKYSIDAYDRYIYSRYILPFCFGNLSSRDYHGDSLNVTFPRFPYCFPPFPLVFPHFSHVVSTVFPHCFPSFLFQILLLVKTKSNAMKCFCLKLISFKKLKSSLPNFINLY